MKPRCWDSEADWDAWNKCNELAGSSPGRALDHYCVDCEPDYQARMIAQCRCGYPTVTFIQIMERQRDPLTGRVTLVNTGMVRGRRSPEDEEAWQLRYVKQQEELRGKTETD